MELVALLEALEARASLLRQTNATLESIAQALFKSWFIDFDPVRAKAEDLPRFHGTNERIAVRNLVELIQFYERLMRNSSAARP